ncbi:hypothetical protein CFC21_032132 [Triticum aestivum]|uniref:C2 domain-containing protein n=2 Tax=Triticum aestivum TaxID=4565 RepID=A0A3B6DLV4_WHEAT|nr:hypothetical protein CFC21_032132 [Triticum aestivum]
MLGHLVGLVKVRVTRGVNLAIRDLRSSDPYVVVRMGKQDVFDKDTFFDDPMGNAELDIGPLVEAATMRIQLQGVADNSVVKKLVPNRQNCLAEESAIYLSEGTVKQDVVLRLRNVECGEVELQLQWIDIPGSKGASGF